MSSYTIDVLFFTVTFSLDDIKSVSFSLWLDFSTRHSRDFSEVHSFVATDLSVSINFSITLCL